jgi:flagellar basal-body rod modification protein FlgD
MTEVSGAYRPSYPTATQGTPPTGASGTTTAKGASLVGNNEIDQDMFLKLLVAQLKYQDPTNPADSTKFLTETAQFTVVEKLGALSDLNQRVLDTTRSQSAAALVGRSVTYTDASGIARTGTVTATTLGGSPTLTVDGVPVGYDSVTGVGAAGSSSTGSSTGSA